MPPEIPMALVAIRLHRRPDNHALPKVRAFARAVYGHGREGAICEVVGRPAQGEVVLRHNASVSGAELAERPTRRES